MTVVHTRSSADASEGHGMDWVLCVYGLAMVTERWLDIHVYIVISVDKVSLVHNGLRACVDSSRQSPHPRHGGEEHVWSNHPMWKWKRLVLIDPYAGVHFSAGSFFIATWMSFGIFREYMYEVERIIEATC